MENSQLQSLIQQYIQQLNPQEKIAYEIAKNNLKSSFDIEKSIGFLKFKEKIKQKS